jgi:hypothetical protein
MSKPTQSKARPESKAPASQQREAPAVRSPRGSRQRADAGPAVTEPRASSAGDGALRHQQIAQRAYRLWELQGKPTGTDLSDWFEAERQLEAELR